MKLLMLKGLPGSGKSTWARQFVSENQDWVRINKDSIREMMGGWTFKKEKLVIKFRDVIVETVLADKKNVIVDDTNFDPKHEKRLQQLADIYGAEFSVKFFDTPIEECIKNDLKRLASTGERVIRKMYKQYLAPARGLPPPWFTGYPRAIICDIDGTVALHNGRSPYDTELCETDLPNFKICRLVDQAREHGMKIIFVSGREDKFRALTETWLLRNVGIYDALFMRPTGDHRKDDIVKEELYNQNILGKFNIEFVLDDRNRVVDMWRRIGLTCLQVAEGDF